MIIGIKNEKIIIFQRRERLWHTMKESIYEHEDLYHITTKPLLSIPTITTMKKNLDYKRTTELFESVIQNMPPSELKVIRN